MLYIDFKLCSFKPNLKLHSILEMADARDYRKGVKHKQWSEGDMDRAINACRDDDMGLREASRIFNVPRRTLSDRINRKVSSDHPRLGKDTLLTTEEENDLCSIIENIAGSPLETGFRLDGIFISLIVFFHCRTSQGP